MNTKAFNKRKFRYASTSVALTALIIAARLVFNIVFSALAAKFLWYIDLTPELLFTLLLSLSVFPIDFLRKLFLRILHKKEGF